MEICRVHLRPSLPTKRTATSACSADGADLAGEVPFRWEDAHLCNHDTAAVVGEPVCGHPERRVLLCPTDRDLEPRVVAVLVRVPSEASNSRSTAVAPDDQARFRAGPLFVTVHGIFLIEIDIRRPSADADDKADARRTEMTRDDTDPLMTPEEVAAFMRMTEGGLAKWRERGVGPAFIRCVGAIRYRRSAIERFLVGRTVDPDGAPLVAGDEAGQPGDRSGDAA
jgi:hypothetical protein